MNRPSFVLFLFLCCSNALAILFEPVPIKELLDGADGVVHGTYKESNPKRLKTGMIITEHYLDLTAVAGIDRHTIVNKSHYKFVTAGGQWQGIDDRYQGTPTFEQNEEVVLLLKNTRNYGPIVYQAIPWKIQYQETKGTKVFYQCRFSRR